MCMSVADSVQANLEFVTPVDQVLEVFKLGAKCIGKIIKKKAGNLIVKCTELIHFKAYNRPRIA